MIIVIANYETDSNGVRKLVTSHGVDPDTLKSYPLPQEDPRDLGAGFDRDYGEYVLRHNASTRHSG